MIIDKILKRYPDLKLKLLQAKIDKKPYDFVKQNLMGSMIITLVLLFVIISFLEAFSVKLNIIAIIIAGIAFFLLTFTVLMDSPEVAIKKQEHEIAREIIFAGRFLIIEAKSGVPLYNSMVNVAKNFKVIGKYFKELVDKVNMGTSIEEAIGETIETTPSNNFRKILWQILNSLKTGADIASSLDGVVQQITKEQMIEIREYGKKLNPLAMFYMMIAVITPTLGITLMIVIATFLGIKVSMTVLLVTAITLGIIQLLFLNIIRSSRPAVEF